MVFGNLFKQKNYPITPKPKNFSNRRLTTKGLPIFNHWALGKTVIITKERHNGKWSLLGGGCNPHENDISTLQRELKEELGEKIKILKSKDLGIVYTKKQINRILSVQLEGKVDIDYNELETIGFYPLEEKYSKERDALESNMDWHAKKALQYFREKKSYKKYDGSNVQIPKHVFDGFHKKMINLLGED